MQLSPAPASSTSVPAPAASVPSPPAAAPVLDSPVPQKPSCSFGVLCYTHEPVDSEHFKQYSHPPKPDNSAPTPPPDNDTDEDVMMKRALALSMQEAEQA